MISLILTILIFGVIAWVIMQFPIPEPFKAVIWGLLVIFLIIIVANYFGVGPRLR